MTMFLAPYTAIADIDGSPLDAGFLFFGEYGKDPELFPVEVFWDSDFTVPAAQPIRTRNGYPVRNGSPTKVYLKTAQHSIVIKNRNSAFILVDFKNKGWDASFVVDESGRTQQEINDDFKVIEKTRLYVEQFNIGMELDIDPAKVIRRARDYAVANGIKTLWCSKGVYSFNNATKEPVKWTMPFDNGSLPSSLVPVDEHGILPPESTTQMDVYVTLPYDMILRAENYREVVFDLGWSFTGGAIDTNQTIGILHTCEGFDGTYLPSSSNKNRFTKFVRGCVEGITLRNAFIAELFDGVRFQDTVGTVNYENCGFAAISPGMDNVKIRRVFLQNCYAGIISGGWWQQRAANSYGYMPAGADIQAIGWNDAVDIDFMHYSLATDLNSIARMKLIDQFFDTYFYKTANNVTRLSTYKTASSPTTANDVIPYTGAASRGLWSSPRQKRNGTSNRIGQLKIYGSTRPPIFTFDEWTVENCFLERALCVDRTSANNSIGNQYYSAYPDDYVSNTKPFAGVIEQSDVSSLVSTVLEISRANTYSAPSVGSPNGTDRTYKLIPYGFRHAYFEQEYNNSKLLDEKYTWYGLTPANGAYKRHELTTPLHKFLDMPITFKNGTLDSYTASGEIGFKTTALPKSKVTPNNTVKVRVGAAASSGVEYTLAGSISYQQDRTIVKAYVTITLTEEVAALIGGLFIELAGLPEPRPTGSVTLGMQYPKVYPNRLPTIASLEPKASTISVVSGTPYLRLSKDWANTATVTPTDLGVGIVDLIVEFGAAEW